jgi:hypothetical protein
VIKEKTPPEIRNPLKELGGTPVFQPRTEAMMKKVVTRDSKALQEFITASGYFFTLDVTSAAIDEVLRQALSNGGNLSNVKSLITTEIQIPLGIEATKKSIKKGDNVTVGVEYPEGTAPAADSTAVVNKRFFLEVSDPIGLLAGLSPTETPVESTDTSGKDGPAETAAATAPPAEAKVEGEGKAGSEKKVVDGGTLPKQRVIVQDLQIVLIAADDKHAAIKEALFKNLASSPRITVSEENTQYGKTGSFDGEVVKINVTTVKVLAPIELMFDLKMAMPFLAISTVASPLEL